jgi:hypothetical protein
MTDPVLSSERAPHTYKTATIYQYQKSRLGHQKGLDTKTGRLTFGRNVTFTLSVFKGLGSSAGIESKFTLGATYKVPVSQGHFQLN